MEERPFGVCSLSSSLISCVGLIRLYTGALSNNRCGKRITHAFQTMRYITCN